MNVCVSSSNTSLRISLSLYVRQNSETQILSETFKAKKLDMSEECYFLLTPFSQLDFTPTQDWLSCTPSLTPET